MAQKDERTGNIDRAGRQEAAARMTHAVGRQPGGAPDPPAAEGGVALAGVVKRVTYRR